MPVPRTLATTGSILALALTASGVDAQSARGWAWVPFASGFDRPNTVRTADDGSGRLFVVEQAGVIRVLNADGAVLAEPFLDLTALVESGALEQGLLGLAFHPGYEDNGRFFVSYTRDAGRLDHSVVAEYRVSDDPDVADPDSALVILEVPQPYVSHNGGNILFGTDGFLTIGLGDGGPGLDPGNAAQDLGNLLGTFLRIDVDRSTSADGTDGLCGINPNGAYRVPDDNPFVGIAGACDEIWTFGWRNPWRWSFDRATGDLLAGDVGQNLMEEISLTPSGRAGRNYGWSCVEGTVPVGYNPCLPGPIEEPIVAYRHADAGDPEVGVGNCAVAGGYRYRGEAIPALAGTYVFGDYCSGRIWLANEDEAGGWSLALGADTRFRIASFGEDEDGELYLADHRRHVLFRLVPTVFDDGFESGSAGSWSAAKP